MAALAEQNHDAPTPPPFPPKLLEPLRQAVGDLAAGHAIVVPIDEAPLFLATLAALTKASCSEDLSAAEMGLLRAWERALPPVPFEPVTREDIANAVEITSDEQLVEVLGFA